MTFICYSIIESFSTKNYFKTPKYQLPRDFKYKIEILQVTSVLMDNLFPHKKF